MKKIVIGIGLGTLAGLADMIPMLVQKLPVNACLSAFSLWVITGLFVAIIPSKLHPSIKAILIALLILVPDAFIIGWEKPSTLIPILIMTVILGALLGFFYKRFTRDVTLAAKDQAEEPVEKSRIEGINS